jgi:hypothetical protein
MQIVTKEFRHSIIAISFSILLILAGTSLFLLNIKHVMAPALITPRSQPTSNIVNTKASYEILFTTATAGSIKTITVAFPTGFYVGAAILIERSGIGAGTLSASGTTLTYTVTTPVSIPAGIPIRLELANINHPSTPGTFLITITTKNSLGGTIDGPTSATTFITQIGTAAIADRAITNPKIATLAVTDRTIDFGAVTTGDIADGAVTKTKMSPGAVSLTNFIAHSANTVVHPGSTVDVDTVPCSTGSIASGGTFEITRGSLQILRSEPDTSTGFSPYDEWFVEAFNPTSSDSFVQATVVCITTTP